MVGDDVVEAASARQSCSNDFFLAWKPPVLQAGTALFLAILLALSSSWNPAFYLQALPGNSTSLPADNASSNDSNSSLAPSNNDSLSSPGNNAIHSENSNNQSITLSNSSAADNSSIAPSASNSSSNISGISNWMANSSSSNDSFAPNLSDNQTVNDSGGFLYVENFTMPSTNAPADSNSSPPDDSTDLRWLNSSPSSNSSSSIPDFMLNRSAISQNDTGLYAQIGANESLGPILANLSQNNTAPANESGNETLNESGNETLNESGNETLNESGNETGFPNSSLLNESGNATDLNLTNESLASPPLNESNLSLAAAPPPQNVAVQGKIRVGEPVRWKLVVDKNRTSDSIRIPSGATLLSITSPDAPDMALAANLAARFERSRNELGQNLSVHRKKIAAHAPYESLRKNQSEKKARERARPFPSGFLNSSVSSQNESSTPDLAPAQNPAFGSSPPELLSESLSVPVPLAPAPSDVLLGEDGHALEVPVNVSDVNSSLEVQYETPAPQAEETNTSATSKSVLVSSDTHYENIEASAALPMPVGDAGAIRLYWTIFSSQNLSSLNLTDAELAQINSSGKLTKEIPFSASDSDNDTLFDTIIWTVPSLSNQSYDIRLTILNVYSHPILGGNWTIGFNATGNANLTVTATIDTNYTDTITRWSDSSEDDSLYDLKFLKLQCGNNDQNYQWLGSSCDSSECSAFVENYSCNDTSYVVSKELIPRKHVLKFDFGNLSAYAYNDVAITTCQNLSTVGTTYTLGANLTVTNNVCFNVTAVNVTLDCFNNNITGNATRNVYAVFSNASNTTVRNCTFINMTWGIYYNGTANNSRIINVSIRNTNPNAINPGTHVIGIYSVANQTYITNVNITNLSAAAGLDNTSAVNNRGNAGGNAFGIYLNGTANSIITNTTIKYLYGGAGGASGANQTGGAAGNTTGIFLHMTNDTNFTSINITNLTGARGGNGNTSASGGEVYGVYINQTSSRNIFLKINMSNFTGGLNGSGTNVDGPYGLVIGFYLLSSSYNNNVTMTSSYGSYSIPDAANLNYLGSAPLMHFYGRTNLNISDQQVSLSTVNSTPLMLGEATAISTLLSLININTSIVSYNSFNLVEGGEGSSGVSGAAGSAGATVAGIYVSNTSNKINITYNNISNIGGAQGGAGGVNGTTGSGGAGGAAYGIWANFLANGTIFNNSISNVTGGLGGLGGCANNSSQNGGNGGAGGIAYGFYFTGVPTTNISHNNITNITGGNGALGGPRGNGSLGGAGGYAAGIWVNSSIGNQTFGYNQISWVIAGAGANGISNYTGGIGGVAAGLNATTVNINSQNFANNTIANIIGGAGGNVTNLSAGAVGSGAVGIFLATITDFNVTANNVSNITGGAGGIGGNSIAGTSTGTGAAGGIAYGIQSNPTTAGFWIGNSIINVTGGAGGKGGNASTGADANGGAGGVAYGMLLSSSPGLRFSTNSIINVTGGAGALGGTNGTGGTGGAGANAYGIYLLSGAYAALPLDGNNITNVFGGQGGNGTRNSTSGIGGSACGLNATGANVNTSIFSNNTITNIIGGNSGNVSNNSAAAAAGGAVGIFLATVAGFNISHNNITNVSGGNGGFGGDGVAAVGGAGGAGGIAYGVQINAAAGGNLVNNNINWVDAGNGGVGGRASTTTAGTGGAGGVAYGVLFTDARGRIVGNNSITNVTGGYGGVGGATIQGGVGGAGGVAEGFYVLIGGPASTYPVANNYIATVLGGMGGNGTVNQTSGVGGAAYGFNATGATVNTSLFTNNSISTIIGGNSGNATQTNVAVAAAGIGVGISYVTISNFNTTQNNITNITGGNGGNGGVSFSGLVGTGGTGANAYGIWPITGNIQGTMANNTVSYVVAGNGGAGGNTSNQSALAGTGGAGGIGYGTFIQIFQGGIIANSSFLNIEGGNGGVAGTNGTAGIGGAGGVAYGFYYANGTNQTPFDAINITNVSGGWGANGTINGSAGAGGNAFGFYATGLATQRRNLTNSDIYNVIGGAAGNATNVSAGSVAGTAVGVYWDTAHNISINNTDIYNITGGQGGNGGSATNGGSTPGAGTAGGLAYGIQVNNLNGSMILGNRISYVIGANGGVGGNATTAASGTGGAGGLAYGIYVQNMSNGTIANNTIFQTFGGQGAIGGTNGTGGTGGAGGAAVGLYVPLASNNTPFTGNNITGVVAGNGAAGSVNNSGGIGGLANGFYATSLSLNARTLNGNIIANVEGGDAGATGLGTGPAAGANGGVSIGIGLLTITTFNISNNNLTNITSGAGGASGTNNTAGLPGQAVGIAYTAITNASSCMNNTITQVIAAQGGNGTRNGTATAGGMAIGINLTTTWGVNFSNNTMSNFTPGAAGINLTNGVPGANGIETAFYMAVTGYNNTLTPVSAYGSWWVLNTSLDNTMDGDPVIYLYNTSKINISDIDITLPDQNSSIILLGESPLVSTGMYLYNVNNSQFFDINISSVYGMGGASGAVNTAGSVGGSAFGVYVGNSSSNVTLANFTISGNQGGTGGSAGFGTTAARVGGAGGIAYAAFISGGNNATNLTNATIFNITGGTGGSGSGNITVGNGGGAGGNSVGVNITQANVTVWNSNISMITGGRGGEGGIGSAGGNGGVAAGLSVTSLSISATVNANNSSIINNSILNITGGIGMNGTNNSASGTGGVAYGLFMGWSNGSIINYTNINNVSGGTNGTGGAQQTGYGIYLVNTAYANNFQYNINEVTYQSSTMQKFLAGQAQNTASQSNTGWWPLISSTGSAAAQANTAWFNRTSGKDNALATVSTNRYWYNNLSTNASTGSNWVGIVFTNGTSGANHWFLANATAKEPDWGIDYFSWKANPTSGSCVNYTNSTSGIYRSVVFNCSGTPFVSSSVNVTFNDSVNNTINYTAANIFPNQVPNPSTSISPNGGEAVTASPASISWSGESDSDGDSLTYRLWFSNDSGTTWYLIDDTASSPYSWDVSALYALDAYKVRVSANDSYNMSANYSSASNFSISLINNAPVILSSRIDPAPEAYPSDTLLGYCNASDAENGSVFYHYVWYRDTALFSSGTVGAYPYNATVDSADATSNDAQWTNPANADDNDWGTFASQGSNGNYSIYFNYSLPTSTPDYVSWEVQHGTLARYNISLPAECWNHSIVQLRIWGYRSGGTYGSGPMCNNTTAWLNIGSSDSGGASAAYAYEQSIHFNKINTTFTNKTEVNIANMTGMQTGESWIFQCMANDSNSNSSALNSSATTILAPLNVEPNLTVTTAPATAYEYTDQTCTVKVWDPNTDNATTTVFYYWFLNGINQTNLNGSYAGVPNNTNTVVSTLAYGNVTIGQNWSCFAKADDGVVNSTINFSANITVQDGPSIIYCKNLSTANQDYTLIRNLTTNGTCFNITSSNITLNGNGNNATSNLSGNGIWLQTVKNISIMNISLFNFSTAIQLDGSNDSLINKTNISNSSSYAIYSNNSTSNIYDYLNLSNNSQGGIRLDLNSGSNAVQNSSSCIGGLDLSNQNSTNAGGNNRCDTFINWTDANSMRGCARTCSSFWERYLGNITGTINLTDGSHSVFSWNGINYTLYFADYDSNIHWSALKPIGRKMDGTASSNDFTELDTKFGSTGAYDSIKNTYSSDGTSPLATRQFLVYGTSIDNVPIANSTRFNTSFRTGILWDSTGGGEYNLSGTAPPTVWAVNDNLTVSSDVYGDYNYLQQIPAGLATEQTGTDLVSIYFEIR